MGVKNLIVATATALMFALWLAPGWWNLGWAVIGGAIIIYLALSYPIIRTNGYLRILALTDLLLTLLMWQWNNGVVKGLSFLGWWLMTGTLVVLAKNPKGEVGWVSATFTFLNGVINFLTSGIEIFGWWKTKKGRLSKWKKFFIGGLFSVPVLVIFGGLFYSADPLFAQLVAKIPFPDWKLDGVMVRSIILSFIFLGSIYALLVTKLAVSPKMKKSSNLAAELSIVSLVAVTLFGIFDILQIRYFTDSAQSLQKAGIMLSEYTRRGYGEMILAGFLAFFMISLMEHLGSSKLLKRLRLVLLIEIVWMILAATRRNYLYQANFGLTEIRILGFFFSLWLLGACEVYIKKTILNLENGWLIKKLVLATGLVLVILNIYPINKAIAQWKVPNLGYGDDYYYLSRLSADGYQGWEKVLVKVENDIKNQSNFADDNVVWLDINLIDSIKWHLKGELNPQSEKYWHYYGAWNPSSKEGRKYLLTNWERLIKAEQQLEIERKRIEVRDGKTN